MHSHYLKSRRCTTFDYILGIQRQTKISQINLFIRIKLRQNYILFSLPFLLAIQSQNPVYAVYFTEWILFHSIESIAIHFIWMKHCANQHFKWMMKGMYSYRSLDRREKKSSIQWNSRFEMKLRKWKTLDESIFHSCSFETICVHSVQLCFMS